MRRALQNVIYAANSKHDDLKIIDNVISAGSSSMALKTQIKSRV